VFPVKCNHDKDLIRSIVKHGEQYGFGLEVGLEGWGPWFDSLTFEGWRAALGWVGR
jgi:hypothetical protein